MKRFIRTLPLVAVVLSAGTFCVRAKDQIEAYRIPKPKKMAQPATPEKPSAPGLPPMTGSVPTAPAGDIHWHAPAGWEEVTPKPPRLGQFEITGADGAQATVAITSFPGNVGSEVDNWNRWQRELGLEETGVETIQSTSVPVGMETGKLYDLVGAKERTLVAALKHGDAMWFFKLRGNPALVGKNEPVLKSFLADISFAGHEGHAPKQEVTPPPAPVASPAPTAPAAAETKEEKAEAADGPVWTVPTNWQEKPPGMMVRKSFATTNDKGTATVSISSFPGDVGGKLANVNRWRGQLGLAPVTEADLPKETTTLDVQGSMATVVDIAGTDSKTQQPARLVAVMVPHGDETWFYKLQGPAAAVEGEKAALLKFIQTARLP